MAEPSKLPTTVVAFELPQEEGYLGAPVPELLFCWWDGRGLQRVPVGLAAERIMWHVIDDQPGVKTMKITRLARLEELAPMVSR